MSDYATNLSKSIVHTTKRLTQMIDEVRQKQAQAERDEIIRMAEQVGCGWTMNGTEPLLTGEAHIQRFATLVAAAEREACAKLCEQKWGAAECAEAIRARKD
jgi:hypothetical protein